MKVCNVPGCPTLHDNTGSTCTAHARQADKRRGTRQQRGYNAAHDKLRTAWAPIVATGTVLCARCHHPIPPHTPWDLGHNDHDRTQYSGPEHLRCNRATKGRKG